MLPRCEVCEQRLMPPDVWSCVRRGAPASYPYQTFSGDRQEKPVKWICGRCLRRAARHRRAEPDAALSHPERS